MYVQFNKDFKLGKEIKRNSERWLKMAKVSFVA
jgi:hypothetical protein